MKNAQGAKPMINFDQTTLYSLLAILFSLALINYNVFRLVDELKRLSKFLAQREQRTIEILAEIEQKRHNDWDTLALLAAELDKNARKYD